MRRAVIALLLFAVFAAAASFCIVILDETEQGFRTLWGKPRWDYLPFSLNKPVLTQPGWYVRIPVLQEITRYDRRKQRYRPEPKEVRTSEKLTIEVDYYVIWRVADPELFRLSVRNETGALQQIDTQVGGAVGRVLGRHPLAALLSEKRREVSLTIAEEARAKLEPRGIELVDLRIRGVDYPDKNLPGVFGRMRSERGRKAKEARAKGEEEALKIRASADLESQVVAAEAHRDAVRARGEGDAKAAEIYAAAYSRDPEFYAFLRSLEAYKRALDDETTLILSPKSPFLKYLFQDGWKPTP